MRDDIKLIIFIKFVENDINMKKIKYNDVIIFNSFIMRK